MFKGILNNLIIIIIPLKGLAKDVQFIGVHIFVVYCKTSKNIKNTRIFLYPKRSFRL